MTADGLDFKMLAFFFPMRNARGLCYSFCDRQNDGRIRRPVDAKSLKVLHSIPDKLEPTISDISWKILNDFGKPTSLTQASENGLKFTAQSAGKDPCLV